MVNRLRKLMMLSILFPLSLGTALISGEVDTLFTPTKEAVSYTTSEDLNDHDTNHPSGNGWTALTSTNYSSGITGGTDLSEMSYYYLEDNITLESTITISNYVTLCLNGKELNGDSKYTVITVSSNAYFNLCDCSSGNTGKITKGNSNLVGGVNVGSNATFNMYGGTISYNESNYGAGGVYVRSNSTFNMYNGEISNNSSNDNVGGVLCESSTFNMYDGKINGNQSYGLAGGLCLVSSSFNMYNGEISNNTSTDGTSGVLCENNSRFNMYGGYFNNDMFQERTTISITGGYLSSDAYTSVRDYIPNGYDAKSIEDDTWKYIVVEDPHSDNVNNQIVGFDIYLDEVSYKNSTLITLTEGNYFLATDLNLDVTIDGTVYLCLNGKTLEGTGTTSVITVSINSNFNLCDCSDDNDGTITGGKGSSGGGVYVDNFATFNMYGGTISNNTATVNGGGVNIASGSTFNMYGGTISNNTADSGGGVFAAVTTINMYNGTFSNNTADHGGGVALVTSTFNMHGGTFSNNNANEAGDGVYLSSGSTLNMHHGYLGDDVGYTGSNSFYISGGYLSKAAKSSIQDTWLCDAEDNQYMIISIQEGDGDFEYKEGYPYAVVPKCDHYSTSSEYERYDTYHTQVCDACSTEFTEPHTYVYVSGDLNNHSAKCECSATVDHNSYKLDYDSSGHYYVCAEDNSCGYQSDPTEHSMGEWYVASETNEVSKCNNCEYTETRLIDAGGDDNQGGDTDGNTPSDGEGDTGDTGTSNDDGDTGSTTTPNDDDGDTGSTTTPDDSSDTGNTTTSDDGDTTTSSDSTGLSAGVIAGIVIGSVLVACLIAFAVYFFVFRKRNENKK